MLTCNTRKRCLWSPQELAAVYESARNFYPLPFPPPKPNHIK
jgi:hypothetical protein